MWPFRKEKRIVKLEELSQEKIYAAEFEIVMSDGKVLEAYRSAHDYYGEGNIQYAGHWALYNCNKTHKLRGIINEDHIMYYELVTELYKIDAKLPTHQITYSDGTHKNLHVEAR